MIRLLRLLHLPFWRRAPLQALLPAVGIALGVGAVVAIDLGSGSTVRSFRFTTERLEGRTTHQILPGDERLDGTLAHRLVRLGGVEAAAPVLEALVLAEEPVRLIGLDPFAESGVRSLGLAELGGESTRSLLLRFVGEPGALAVSSPYLRRHGLAPGDSLELTVGARRHRAFVLAALPPQVDELPVPDNLMLCDLATAQELTGRVDVDRIDLVLPTTRRAEALVELRGHLPPGLRLERPGGRAARLEGMLHALRSNLGALSFLALFVSLFLIYNAMLVAVLRRRPHLGIVRCLGATRREVLGAWLVEATLIGLLGTALGLLLGLAGGRLALAGFARTANDLYGHVGRGALGLSSVTLLKAGVVGLVATLLAALYPALEAARTAPAHTSYRGEVERGARRWRRRAPLLSLPLWLLFALSLLLPSQSPWPGYAAAVSLALGVALVTPTVGDGLLWMLRPLLHGIGGIVTSLAAQNIRASLSRSGVALAALTVALAMSVAMGTMVGSFRQELRDWIGATVRADVYLSPATAEVDRLGARIDGSLAERLAHRPGVVALDSYRGLPASVRGVSTFVAGIQTEIFRTRARPRLLDGASPDIFLDRVENGQAGITEALHRRTGLTTGDLFTVTAGGRRAELRVAGVYRDYSSDRGVVLMDRGAWEASFGAHDPNSIALYLREGVDVESYVDQLKSELAGEYALLIRSNRTLRERAYTVFERTFSVTRALEVIGVAVAAIGILAALLALLLERRRELATLRALGLTQTQLERMLMVESGLLAVLAWLFALGAGSGLAWILLRVVNLRSFGWSLPFAPSWQSWLWTLLLSLLAAGLATLAPIGQSRRIALAEALREE